jgi:tetratricopeptide (TPR) repeat protein
LAKRSQRKNVTAAPVAVSRERGWWVDPALLTSVLAVVALAPFFRGLYFTGEQLVASAVLSILFALTLVQRSLRSPEPLASSALDAAIPALAIAYVVAIRSAVIPRAAIQWALLYTACYFVYWLVSRLSSPPGSDSVARVVGVLHAIGAAAAGVAIAGLAAATGLADIAGAFEDDRIYSTFQYPNTTATWLGAALFLVLALWTYREESAADVANRFDPVSFGYAAAACLLLNVIAFTRSRGALLVLPVAAVANLLLTRRAGRLALSTRAAVAGVAALASLPIANRAVERQDAAWLVPAAAIAAAVLLAGFALRRRVRDAGLPSGRFVKTGLVAAGVAAGALGLLLVPAEIAKRFAEINTETYSAWSRLRWMGDASRALRDHLVSGIGGGGWTDLQYGYQSYAYEAKHVHNHILQVALESGLPGAVAFLAICVAAAFTVSRVLRSWSDARRALAAGVASAIVTLLAHSLIDFNLALAAVSLTLWALFGCLAAMRRLAGPVEVSRPLPARGARVRLGVAAAGAALMAAFSLLLLGGYEAGQRGTAALAAGDLPTARSAYEDARAADPWTASFAIDLGSIADAEGKAGESERLFREGIALAPFNAAYRDRFADVLFRHDRGEASLAELLKARSLRPFDAQRYERLARTEFLVGARATEEGDAARGRPHLEAVLAQSRLLAARRNSEPQELQKSAPEFRLPETTPDLEFDAGRALVLLGDPVEARKRFVRALEKDFGPEMLAWLSVAADARGDTVEASSMHERAVAADPRMDAIIGALRRLAGAARPTPPAGS